MATKKLHLIEDEYTQYIYNDATGQARTLRKGEFLVCKCFVGNDLFIPYEELYRRALEHKAFKYRNLPIHDFCISIRPVIANINHAIGSSIGSAIYGRGFLLNYEVVEVVKRKYEGTAITE